MFSMIFAAAIAAATPATAYPALTYKIGEDAPLVCAARFEEESAAYGARVAAFNSKIIDIYADKAKLTLIEKAALTNLCNMFDVGALFVVTQMKQQEEAERPADLHKPFEDIASFRR